MQNCNNSLQSLHNDSNIQDYIVVEMTVMEVMAVMIEHTKTLRGVMVSSSGGIDK